MTHSDEINSPLTFRRLLDAYAQSIAVFYAAEKAFQADPTAETAHAYDTAAIRLTNLRFRYREGNQLGDAINGTLEAMGR